MSRRRKNSNRWSGYPPYVPVAERKQEAAMMVTKLKKKNKDIYPVVIEGRNIANTFWGKSWCTHLASYSDYENRLPRGRSYVRNGAVLDLKITAGKINALVLGSSIYEISVAIKALKKSTWESIKQECVGKIDSIIELLLGKFPKGIMEIITHKENGLFPDPKEISFDCSCPDHAYMCKHVAAVLYGVGARFDEDPQALFLLRKVDHAELFSKLSTQSLIQKSKDSAAELSDNDLSEIFGIDIA